MRLRLFVKVTTKKPQAIFLMANKLEALKKLSADGTLQGGFATLTENQLLKLRGGSGTTTNNCGVGTTCRGVPALNNCHGALCLS